MLKYSQVLGCGDGSVGNVSCTTMKIRVWTPTLGKDRHGGGNYKLGDRQELPGWST